MLAQLLAWTCLLFLPGLAPAAGTPPPYSSIYTSVAVDQCVPVTTPPRAFPVVSPAGLAISSCPGPEAYRLYVIDDGTRSWYVLENGDRFVSFETPIVIDSTSGDFPNVAVSDKVEWRLDTAGKVIGLIFRVWFQVYDATTGGLRSISRLYVVDLRGAEPSVIGITGDNDSARGLFDAKTPLPPP